MKTARVLLVFLISGLSLTAWSQERAHVQGLRFYENLAERDAHYEQGLHNLSAQDELDYWLDQRNYELQLGKANFSAYLVYMRVKKQAYQEHIQACDGSCIHSPLYLEKAREYLSLSDNDDLFGQLESKVVQHLPKKKGKEQ
ncbi:hypothetical protein [Flagellimonas flava]|uniref:Uncharacterized protein n=1 Tax=Flagellimonas flava TaxID=570519 RepID=A0A1M5M6L9_9FLAO|nr:hypothetical protein [Allomuricauda flava]SHG72898.1 hypothetical protein SAMN04488116_2286 [Allomuricauda flava]